MSVDSYQLSEGTAALITDVRREKYMQPEEASWNDTHKRVSEGLFQDDPKRAVELFNELAAGRACPAGRVLAGAGTDKNVTWWNCFVAPLVQDSMRTNPSQPGLGIMDALASVAYSMQMGGGVGTDFSTLRPSMAGVKRVQATASGPLPFMDMWDGMCRTIMSAGARRGAMMATLRVDHPDVLAFIRAKHDSHRLRMFNVSVLVTDVFMKAVEDDGEFELGHWEPPMGRTPVKVLERPYPYDSGRSKPWYVYEVIRARDLWQILMESTYKYAEPGVIFIDRVNYWNNLGYCEHIECTNPCGEQPLPANSNCNLSHINLAKCIFNTPFSKDCRIDYDAINRVTGLLVRMSDNVIDLSPVPTEAQRIEALLKRRIGLGITGLANVLMFVQARYGSYNGNSTTESIVIEIRNAAYKESIELAKEKGSFPAFNREAYLAQPFIKSLPEALRNGIAEHGIRNALLLTVAPTGTVSIAQGLNSSGGLEPVFLPRYNRKKLEPDGSFSNHVIEDFGFRVYANVRFDGDMDAALAAPLPDYMVTTRDLTPEDHLLTQATVQRYVDSAVSKTINVPTETPFDEFSGIYRRAYDLGCKGCTTYREVPDSGRGAVLSAIETDSTAPKFTVEVKLDTAEIQKMIDEVCNQKIRPRPEILDGRTYRLRWSALPYPMFVTINDEVLSDGRRVPFEVFVNSKAVDNAHWVSALTRMISAVMRKGGDLTFIPDELKQVWSARGGEFIDKRYVSSEVALIGYTLERHFQEIGYIQQSRPETGLDIPIVEPVVFAELGGQCPNCKEPAVIREEGCNKCKSCGWSNCG